MSLLKILLTFVICLLSYSAFSVAFKLKNDASFSVRVRAYDRGTWRPWVTFNPGDWGDFAPEVTRSEHTIQVDMWTNSGWVNIYQGNHGSRAFTRVLQVMDAQDGSALLAWWDEPPFCRGMPPNPKTGGQTCLRESGGWYWQYLYKAAIWIGKAYMAGQ